MDRYKPNVFSKYCDFVSPKSHISDTSTHPKLNWMLSCLSILLTMNTFRESKDNVTMCPGSSFSLAFHKL